MAQVYRSKFEYRNIGTYRGSAEPTASVVKAYKAGAASVGRVSLAGASVNRATPPQERVNRA